MRINHNITALNTYRQLSINTANQSKSMAKLSSGLRINSAADDAAGLAISEKMKSQMRGLEQASRNAQDGISLVQTAEGALSETTDILQRMRELATQSSNDTATDSDRQQMQKEIDQLKSETDRIAGTTQFNTKNLLDGSLSAAKTAQGTVANSQIVKAGDTAATSGTNQAGLAMAVSQAAAGHTGTSYTVIGGAALANNTIIQAGVNDKFDININGVSYQNVTISPSQSQGYTQQQLVDALNTAVKTAVNTTAANDWNNQFNQAVFSLTSDGHLQVATATAGSSSTLKVQLNPPTAGATESSLSAMGFAANVNSVTSSVDLSGGYTVAATKTDFQVTLGKGAATTVDLVTDGGLTAGQTYTLAQTESALQTGLDKKMGQGAITVGDDGKGHITLNSNVATQTFTLAEGTGTTGAGLFGSSLGSATLGSPVTNTTTKGTNTVEAVATGTVISSGANDQFNISVDGGAAQAITLKAGNYATKADLVNEVNNEINNNQNLVGKVTAKLDSTGKVDFVSNSTGSSSSVTVSDPTSKAQSALGALGYEGNAGGVNGATNLAPGVDLTAAGATQMSVTLGNKTATIDLKGYTGIADSTTTLTTTKVSSRDAIVNALQSELDKAFGKGAVTVNTSTTPAGVDTLSLATNANASAFSVSDGGAGLAKSLFGGNVTAAVSAAGNNVKTNGTDTVHNTLSNSTALTQLADSNGNNLGLQAGNIINISGTQNGDGFNTSVAVGANSTISDVLNSIRNLSQFQGATVNLDTTSGKIVVTGENGQTHDISNLKFTAQKSATDTTAISGFNSEFSTFNVTQQAQDAHNDNSLTMAIGANQGQTMNIDINDMSTKGLRIQDVDVSTQAGAQTAMSVIDNAINSVSTERAKLGAFENRLNHTINNLNTSDQNITDASSRITDVDMAKEMMNNSKAGVLAQAAQAMLAQANQQPQQVLQLLRG